MLKLIIITIIIIGYLLLALKNISFHLSYTPNTQHRPTH